MSQSLHPDFETTLDETSYYFLGSGRIQAAIQWSTNGKATPLGLMISDPEHFTRKWSTHLFHPEYGLAKTMLTVLIDGVRYQPDENTRVVWYPSETPAVIAMWVAGGAFVIETFYTSPDEPVLVREVSISKDGSFTEASLELSLYANPALYSEFVGNAYTLGATGYETLFVSSALPGEFKERTLVVPFLDAGESLQTTILYSLGEDYPAIGPHILKEREVEYWKRAGLRWTEQHPSELHHEIERIFTASAMGLRAAVSESGRFDASIWQYGYEWSGDASMVAIALVYSGQFEVAQRLIENLLTRMTTESGMAMESSRFRGGLDAELNNNGEILHACRVYFAWTGSNDYRNYPRIRAIADYLLSPDILNEETGMLVAARDIWERSSETGVLPGYDVSHQTFAMVGLRDAAWIAEQVGEHEDAARWRTAYERIAKSFHEHETHSMIADGRVIKRRLLDGSLQTSLSTKMSESFAEMFVPDGMPLAEEGEHPWEPDVSSCLPIVFGVLDPRSEVARNTVAAMDTLWSQAWEMGGYGRYNVLSEPDSPGPWPFATAIVAGAALEVGDFERAHRAMSWLINTAGAGGNWFEFYGDRPTPPLPPTGIIVWGWAQWIILITRHLLGARIIEGDLKLHPRMQGFRGEVRFKDRMVPIPE